MQSYVAKHRFALNTAAYNIEAFIRVAPVAADQLAKLTSYLDVDSSPDDLDTLRNGYSLLFEAVLWAKIYGFGGYWNKKGLSLKKVDNATLPGGGDIENVSPLSSSTGGDDSPALQGCPAASESNSR